jgi:hypothetical protein
MHTADVISTGPSTSLRTMSHGTQNPPASGAQAARDLDLEFLKQEVEQIRRLMILYENVKAAAPILRGLYYQLQVYLKKVDQVDE